MANVTQNGHVTRLTAASSSQWVEIQRNTFKNWVNEQLKSRGLSIVDIRTDFDDGVMLVALVELLSRKVIPGAIKRPTHNHEKLHNITIALDAVAKDNVTLINIDSSHITDGNVKMIMALIWQLVLRYQIGLSQFQHRSWLLAWVQAVLPDCHVANLTTAWNSGVALHALLEFCKPGLSPRWKEMNPLDSIKAVGSMVSKVGNALFIRDVDIYRMSKQRGLRINNCRDAMKLARQHFGIPLVLRPEDLASSELDELSAITYLSYFTKIGAPGYNSTLQKIQPLVKTTTVFNFTTDWNDGQVLCELVRFFGGDIHTWSDKSLTNIQRLQEGIQGAKGLGIEPIISAGEISEETSEHLGIMAYAARFLNLSPSDITYQHSYNETRTITLEENPVITTHITSSNRSVNHSNLITTTRNFPDTNNLALHINNIDDKDETSSTSSSSSTTTVQSQNSQLEYTLVRTPSLRRKHHKDKTSDEIKKDTYSDGVIIYATSHEVVTPDDIRLEATSPTGRVIKMNGDGMYHAQFGQEEIGEWTVTLLINNKVVDSCRVDVCDPSQVNVSGLRPGMPGSNHKFNVDCSKAGKGKLEVHVATKDGRNVPCFLRELSNKSYSASFTPIESDHYLIRVEYNKAEIRDDAGAGPGEAELHRQAIFSTNMEPYLDHYKITANCDWQIEYMTGGPIHLYIGDTADVRVYSMQDGTVCNVPHLIADLTNAPQGGILDANVTYGPLKFPADVIEDKPGLYKVLFKPKGPGTYRVWIQYGGKLVKGSPFIQEIDELTSPTATGPGLKTGIPAEPAHFKIDARGFPGELSVEIQGPHFPISNSLTENPDHTYDVQYVPEETGIHRIHIKLSGKDITGSPFHPKVVDPHKIRVSGGWRPLLDDQERIPLVVGKEKHIPFDASEAGPGELTSKVHGPSYNIPVTVDSRGDGKHTLIFVPREEGKHYIDVFWNDFPLDKSPFVGFAVPYKDEPEIIDTVVHVKHVPQVEVRKDPVMVERGPSNRHSEPPGGYWIRADRKPRHVDNGPQKVYILAPGKSEPSLDDSRRSLPPTRIHVQRHGSDVMHYKRPKHYLSPVQRSGSLRSGSTNPTIRSEPNRRKEPDVMFRKLPRDKPLYYDTPNTSDSFIYYTSPQSSSPPSVSPNSYYTLPMPKKVNEPVHDSPKVVLKGKGLKEAEVNRPAVFHIDGRNAGPGEPEAKIASIKSEPPIHIQPTGPKQYKCTYVPKVPGAYLLDIKWANKPLKVCPFKVDVHQPVYPEKVGVTGPNIKTGVIGKDLDLQIDPREAGHGELTVDCIDPDGQPVNVNLTDNFDGTYRLRVRPVKPGKHILNIRLNKQHVFGSPYAIEVKGHPGSGMIKVYGPGLESGVFPDYKGYFFVDATGAGGGELHVSVMGLKGAFHVEMKRASQKDKLFNCLYHPLEPGLYTINVQWSGTHVNGSPFKVFVAQSEMDLLDYESQLNRSRASSGKSSSKLSPNTTEESIHY